jgi:hypothetical protein
MKSKQWLWRCFLAVLIVGEASLFAFAILRVLKIINFVVV